MKYDGISIIIPCYNVEMYLEGCLESIFKQDIENYEIILIDDCSTDKTAKIIKKYEKKYDFIKGIYNEKNSGAGYSRNRALKEAKYNIVSFIDSDDYIEENFYSSMFSKMIKSKADIAVCDIYIRYGEGFVEEDVRNVSGRVNGDKLCFIDNGLAASPCNKLFNKQLLIDNPFAEGIMNEDIPAVLAAVIKSNKIVYDPDTFYNYVQRKSSVQNETLSYKRFDIFKALDILETRIKKEKSFKKIWPVIIYHQIIMFFIYVIPKESSFIKRAKFLKQYYILSKKYNIRQNFMLLDFIDCQGTKHKYYYKLLLFLNSKGLSYLSSLLISFYRCFSKLVKKYTHPVIKENIIMEDLIECAKKQSKMKSQKYTVSVIVPNYNYEKFMYERLYSILYQTKKVDEIIILDDCSTDNSRELIDNIVTTLSKYINIKKIYNEKNSGSPFKQWEKGFKNATSDYVWIAEADDYCKKNFIASTMRSMKNNDDIVLSYVDTAFIDKNGKIILRTIKREIDIMKTGHWDKNFVNDGIDEIKNYAYLNCTIANVSSVIFRRSEYNEFFKESGSYRQAGDWLFYVNVMSQGKVAFTNKPINFYRVHGNNVTSTTKKKQHFNEIVKIHKTIENKFKLNKKQKKEIEKRYEFLKRVWQLDD